MYHGDTVRQHIFAVSILPIFSSVSHQNSDPQKYITNIKLQNVIERFTRKDRQDGERRKKKQAAIG
jgi:hypothetical protein